MNRGVVFCRATQSGVIKCCRKAAQRVARHLGPNLAVTRRRARQRTVLQVAPGCSTPMRLRVRDATNCRNICLLGVCNCCCCWRGNALRVSAPLLIYASPAACLGSELLKRLSPPARALWQSPMARQYMSAQTRRHAQVPWYGRCLQGREQLAILALPPTLQVIKCDRIQACLLPKVAPCCCSALHPTAAYS